MDQRTSLPLKATIPKQKKKMKKISIGRIFFFFNIGLTDYFGGRVFQGV